MTKPTPSRAEQRVQALTEYVQGCFSLDQPPDPLHVLAELENLAISVRNLRRKSDRLQRENDRLLTQARARS